MARGADITENVAAANVLPGGDGETGEVGIKRLNAVAVVDDDLTSVACAQTSLDDRAVGRNADRVANSSRDIDAAMESAFPVEGIKPRAERAGDNALYRPLRGSIRHVHRMRRRTGSGNAGSG